MHFENPRHVYTMYTPTHPAESNRERLVQGGGVSVFVRLLGSKDADVQFYCAAALSNLAVHG